ncbi:MAG: hypothetical protein ACXABD_18270 [Candidatus Thorarchaeota archaeon]
MLSEAKSLSFAHLSRAFLIDSSVFFELPLAIQKLASIGILFGLGQFATGHVAICQFALGKYVLAQLGLGKYVWSMTRSDPESQVKIPVRGAD